MKPKAKRTYLVYGSDGIPTATVFGLRRSAIVEALRLNTMRIQKRNASKYFEILKRRPFRVMPVLPVLRKKRS